MANPIIGALRKLFGGATPATTVAAPAKSPAPAATAKATAQKAEEVAVAEHAAAEERSEVADVEVVEAAADESTQRLAAAEQPGPPARPISAASTETVPQLRARAKEAGITGYSRMTKAELLDRLG